MKSWVKLYTEINRDPDFGLLTWAQRGIWSALLALAGEIDDRDEDGRETGATDTVIKTAWRIRCPIDELTEAIAVFSEQGMVIVDQFDTIYLPNFAKRQARPPSQLRGAQRERQREYRASQPCHNLVTSPSQGVTPSDTDTDTDTEVDSELDSESEKDTDTDTEETFAVSDFVSQGVRAYENTVGLISGMRQSEEIRMTLETLQERDLGGWWQTSLDIAADNNKRSWSYVRAIIDNHLRDGTAPMRKNGPVQGPSPPKRQIVSVIDPQTGERQKIEATL